MLRSAMMPPMTAARPKAVAETNALDSVNPDGLQDPRSVVHDRVDAGELLGDRDTDADEHDPPQPSVGENVFEAELVAAGLLLLGNLDHLSELRLGAIFGAHRLEHGERLLVVALLDQPAG